MDMFTPETESERIQQVMSDSAASFQRIALEEGSSIGSLQVRDKEKWNGKIGQLVPLFYPLIKEAYVPQGTQEAEGYMQMQVEVDLHNADYVYMYFDASGRMSGYLSMQSIEHKPDIGVVRDVIVRGDERVAGIGRKLLGQMFQDGMYTSIIGITANPIAIHLRMTEAERHGYFTYIAPTETSAHIGELIRETDNYIYESGITVPESANFSKDHPGYSLIRRDMLAPVTQEVVDSIPKSNNALRTIFSKIKDLQSNTSDATVVTYVLCEKKQPQ